MKMPPPAADAWPSWTSALRQPRAAHDLRILTWNVAGLRGLLARQPSAIADLLAAEAPDILCLQETKLQNKHVAEVSARLDLSDAWTQAWECSTHRLGHAGVAIFSRVRPQAVHRGLPSLGELASGRVIGMDFDGFRLVNTYSPNAGEGLKNIVLRVDQYDPALAKFLQSSDLPTVLTGDLNVAPEPADVYDPVRLGRIQAPGFSDRERQSFRDNYQAAGWVDAFRALHPQVRAYTFYSYRMQMRSKGKGWRLDHFLVPPALMPRVADCYVVDSMTGSDHVPVGLALRPAGLSAGRTEAP